MIRGLFRLFGLLLLAAGFVFLVYDGARTIADQRLQFTRLDEVWNDLHQGSQAAFQGLVETSAPWLWDHAVRVVLAQPAWLVLGAVGLFLMLACRPRKPLIGYARD